MQSIAALSRKVVLDGILSPELILQMLFESYPLLCGEWNPGVNDMNGA